MNKDKDSDKIKNKALGDIIQLISFSIDEEEFCVEIHKVLEIIRMSEITRLPNSPEFINGVINLRGKIIPVVDLRKRLGIKSKPHDIFTRIIIFELENNDVGFIVDFVNEVIRVDISTTEIPPTISSNIDSDMIQSIVKLDNRLLILLDMNKVLKNDEVQFIKEIDKQK